VSKIKDTPPICARSLGNEWNMDSPYWSPCSIRAFLGYFWWFLRSGAQIIKQNPNISCLSLAFTFLMRAMSQATFISCLGTPVSSERTVGQQAAAAATWRNTRTRFSVLRLFTVSPHKSGRGKRPHLNTSSHLTKKKTTMDSSANTSSHPSRCGGGESYRWITLPSIGTAVKGCHLVPMKVPLSMKEDDISIEEGGLTIRKVDAIFHTHLL